MIATERVPRAPRVMRNGATVEEHRARVAAGEAWCGGHKAFHPVAEFGAGWACRAYHRDDQRARRAARQEANHAV